MMDFDNLATPRYQTPKQKTDTDLAAAYKMLTEAIAALPADRLASCLFVAICDDARFTPEQLEDLSNRIGRAGHERARAQW